MKWTNKHDLVEPLYRAIVNDKYVSRGYISTTVLSDSPRIRILKQRHYKELSQDVADNMWALFGTACHHIIELASENCPDYISEIPLEMEVLGKKLSGTADLYDKKKKILYDFKVTSVWSATKKEDYSGWEAQMNIYAYMLRQMGYEVNQIVIVAILKDWHQAEVMRNYSGSGIYPSVPVKEISLKMYTDTNMLKFMENRMQMHVDAEKIDAVLPDCTERERWTKKSQYAVSAPHLKRAIRVFDSEEEAQAQLEIEKVKKNNKKKGSGDKLFIKTREGRDVRCESFCAVSQFCDQRKKILADKENQSNQ